MFSQFIAIFSVYKSCFRRAVNSLQVSKPPRMSCVYLDRDQAFTVHDFGPRGYVGNVTVNLTHGLQPGAMISAVLLSDQEMYVAVFDTKSNQIFSFGARVKQGQLACNSLIDGKWGTEILAKHSPWRKGVRASFCLLYDSDGYRVFVNGESVMSMEHRSKNPPDNVQITNGQVFKVIYQTTIDVIP